MPYYVYILASRSRTLYTDVTNDIHRRVWEHREGLSSSFARQYRIHRLVYLEPHEDARAAIALFAVATRYVKGTICRIVRYAVPIPRP